MHGQPRFINNPYALSSHQKQILEKYSCEVLCHTWYGGSFSGSASSWSGMEDVAIVYSSLEEIKDRLHPIILDVDAPREFSLPKQLEKKLLSKFHGENGWTKKNISNVMSSLYSIERVVRAAKKIDLSGYDFVILSRYDNLIYRLPDLNLLDKNLYPNSIKYSKS
jgi:hypothetical protein